MADLPVPINYEVPEPAHARKKWMEAQIQEKKSRLFSTRQMIDHCEQQIEDIRNGKIKALQHSMIMLEEQIKHMDGQLNAITVE